MLMNRRVNRRRGFSLMELLIVVAILMIIGAIAIPRISTAMMNAKEMAATREMHNLITAETQYMSQFGRYAASLQELGPPTSGQPNPSGADLITKDMAAGLKNGYKYNLQGSPQGFFIQAIPQQFGNSGRRTFYTDQTGVIRQNWGQEPATATSDELK